VVIAGVVNGEEQLNPDVLLIPVAVIGAIAVAAIAVWLVRYLRTRARVREIEKSLRGA
jgi:ABC-type uncharacterized transport system permease subunit